MHITVGADPEIFLRQNGVPHSAWELIPGNKEKPHAVRDGAVQVDGCAVEFNIDPVSTKEAFRHNINSVLSVLRDMVPPEYEFDMSASIEFTASHFASLPPEALELGCDPDLDAYTMEENEAPDAESRIRAAGGHVHVGWREPNADPTDPSHRAAGAALAKGLDWFLGMPSAVIDPDKVRKSLYGCAGAFRAKPYGMEYRTLSNFWLKNDGLIDFVYDRTMQACEAVMSGGFRPKVLDTGLIDEATAIINGLVDGPEAEEWMVKQGVITSSNLMEMKELAHG
jgi:hypothetical protein